MEKMTLPTEWLRCTLSDIAEINPSKIKKDQNVISGFVPMSHAPTNYIGKLGYEERLWGDISKSYTNFKNDDVIIAKVTPCFENGKAAIIRNMPNGIGAGSSEFYVLRPRNDSILSRYIFAILKTRDFLQEGAANMTGAVGLRRVPRAFIENFVVPLPSGAEQKIITDKLDDLLVRVESIKTRLENIPEILKKFRQSVLNAAVNGNLTEAWRNNNCCSHNPTLNIQIEKKKWITNNPNHNEAKRVIKRLKEFNGSQKDVGEELPDSWSWQKLEDSVLMIVDCHNKTAPYSESGIPIIRTSNIRNGNLNWEGMKYVEREIYEYWSRRCPPEAGDIIFTREAPMGEATIIPPGQQFCLGQRTMLIRAIEKHVTAKFILTVLMAPSFRKKAESFAVGTGVKHYRVGDVSNLFIPVPPTEEQNEIVRRVDLIFGYADSIQQMTDSALKRISNLTHSILARAFRGELTAQWREENSELISGLNSAEALLERIVAEKMEFSITKKCVKKSAH